MTSPPEAGCRLRRDTWNLFDFKALLCKSESICPEPHEKLFVLRQDYRTGETGVSQGEEKLTIRAQGKPENGEQSPSELRYGLILALPAPPPSKRESKIHTGPSDHRANWPSKRIRRDCEDRSYRRFLMQLPVPIYVLKRQAKRLSRENRIPLNEALDSIALQQGYRAWSLLAARYTADTPAKKLFGQLRQGDLLLVGARPGQGKTLLALELAVEAMKAGNPGAFFTLEYTEIDILDRLRAIGVKPSEFHSLFEFDCSDAINADYIIHWLASAARGTLVVIDYLQLLDQNRASPPLSVQVAALKLFVQDRGLMIVFISQIDRTYDPLKKRFPDLQDVRLPNPLDLQLFDKMCFLNNGSIQVQTMAPEV
jgi:hypothetical protein